MRSLISIDEPLYNPLYWVMSVVPHKFTNLINVLGIVLIYFYMTILMFVGLHSGMNPTVQPYVPKRHRNRHKKTYQWLIMILGSMLPAPPWAMGQGINSITNTPLLRCANMYTPTTPTPAPSYTTTIPREIVSHMTTHETHHQQGPITLRWDTDSSRIRVDNCCTKSISNEITDFDPTTLVPVIDQFIHGTVEGSGLPIKQMGTIVWKILDDTGTPRHIRVPNSYFIPGTVSKLLSPQHWAQERRDNHPKMHGTRCITNSDAIILQWDQMKYTKTIPLDPSGNNVADMRTQPGYIVAETVINRVQNQYRNNITFPSNIINIEYPDPYGPNEDAEYLPIEVPDEMVHKVVSTVPLPTGQTEGAMRARKKDAPVIDLRNPMEATTTEELPPQTANSDTNRIPTMESPTVHVLDYQGVQEHSVANTPDPMDETDIKNQKELLRWHNRMGHLSMHRLQEMASKGLLASKIAKCRVPICQSCMYGSLTRQP
jgi:GAG-pre-integrase domain